MVVSSPQRGERDEHAKTFRNPQRWRGPRRLDLPDCKKVTFSGDTQSPAARAFEAKERRCRNTRNGLASTIQTSETPSDFGRHLFACQSSREWLFF
jgi:hypothetical protein